MFLGPKMLYLDLWAGMFKNHSHIWNQRPRIYFTGKCGAKKKEKKKKHLKFRTKNTRFFFWEGGGGQRGTRIWKYYCRIWNRHYQISLTAKFLEIIKMPKFGTKNHLLAYFWATICKKLLSYLKSAPSNLFNCKIYWKNENV